MKFLSPEVALYLYKSTKWPCRECSCHVWAGAPNCYVELLDKLQKQICRIAGLLLAPSLEPLSLHWNVASLSLFYSVFYITLVDAHLNWLNWFCFIISVTSLFTILMDCMIFFVTIDVTRMSISTVSFLKQLDSGILYRMLSFELWSKWL